MKQLLLLLLATTACAEDVPPTPVPQPGPSYAVCEDGQILKVPVGMQVPQSCEDLLRWAACPPIDGLRDVNCDGKLTIVAFGDSITEGAGDEYQAGGYPTRLQGYFPNTEVINMGVGGETTDLGIIRAQSALPAADYVIVLEGINDRWANPSVKRTCNNLYGILDIAASRGAVPLLGKVLRPGWYQRAKLIKWADSINARIKRQIDIPFSNIHISKDGLHPDARGYEAMAKQVAKVLRRQ